MRTSSTRIAVRPGETETGVATGTTTTLDESIDLNRITLPAQVSLRLNLGERVRRDVGAIGLIGKLEERKRHVCVYR